SRTSCRTCARRSRPGASHEPRRPPRAARIRRQRHRRGAARSRPRAGTGPPAPPGNAEPLCPHQTARRRLYPLRPIGKGYTVSADAHLELAERQTPGPVKARQRAAETRRARAQEKALAERDAQFRRWEHERREQLAAALAGPQGPALAALV